MLRTKDLAMSTTADLILKLAEEHPSWSNAKIAEEVRRRKPGARTTAASVSSTKSRAGSSGSNSGIPDRREQGRVHIRVPPDVDPRTLRSMIESGESAELEFKSTALRNHHTGEKDPRIIVAVVKTIAAFMNTEGGTLLVGVDDGGRSVGIEQDYQFVKRPDRDSWELWLTNVVKSALGPVAATDFRVGFCTLDDRTIARIDVCPGSEPVYNRDNPPKFYARLNNSTEALWGPQLHSYLRKRWPG